MVLRSFPWETCVLIALKVVSGLRWTRHLTPALLSRLRAAARPSQPGDLPSSLLLGMGGSL